MQIYFWNINLKVRLIGEALFNMLFWMYFPFITVYFSGAFGNHIASLLMTVPPIFSIIGGLLGGDLADRLGRRPVMLLGVSFQTVMFALFALSLSHWIDYISFIGIGLGGALCGPASSAMVADLVPAEHRRQIFAMFTTVSNIGVVLGPAIGAIFFFHYRQALLWTCALVALLYVIAIYCIVYETRPKTTEQPKASITISQVFTEQWKGYGIIFGDKVFLIYIMAGIFALMAIMQLDLYWAVYVINEVPAQALFPWIGDSLVLSGKEIFGCLLGLNGLMFVVLIVPVTKWFLHWKDRQVFILSSLLAGAGAFALGLCTNIWYLFVATVIFTFGEIVRSPVTQSFISSYAPDHERGQYMGANSLQNTVARFFAPVTVFLSGWVPDIGIFSIILVFALISIVLYIKMFGMYEDKAEVVD